MPREMSLLQKKRAAYRPVVPDLLQDPFQIQFITKEAASPTVDQEKLRSLFPRTANQPFLKGAKGKTGRSSKPLSIGVLFSGGQAPGGHTVIAGLFDMLQTVSPESQLFGFLGGPSGIIQGKYRKIGAEELALFRNQGGFDLLGSGRTKIETEADLAASLSCAQKLHLDGLVIIGGDDSHTNAAHLAEYFREKQSTTKVIGVPKTIDGDLQNAWVSISFGFDTATKTYSELIGNIQRDAISAKKYTHFIKLMGRSASHIALECALATHPNFTLIGEEIAAQNKNLRDVVKEIADLIAARGEKGKNYGVILISEGIIEFLSDVKVLMQELNRSALPENLSDAAKATFALLPEKVQKQLLLERDPHGNVQLSLIETESLLSELVAKELQARGAPVKFAPLHHFLGYEGRSALPTNFDCNYCYALGMTAALLVQEGASGYMCYVHPLHKPVAEWSVGGIPLTTLMHFELRKGSVRPVIKKALVDLRGKAFLKFQEMRKSWMLEDAYLDPGPIQFFGEPEYTDHPPSIIDAF